VCSSLGHGARATKSRAQGTGREVSVVRKKVLRQMELALKESASLLL
jgi:hypothetical protein